MAGNEVAAVKGRFLFLGKIDNRGFDRKLAASRHRIARVHRQIENDLGNLAWVCLDMRAFFLVMEMADHGNIFADETKQRAFEICDDGIDFHDNGFAWLSAAESKELLSQSGRAPCGSADFGDVIGKSPFDLALLEQQIAVTENGGEKIIEIMRDAAGQLPECFHFLRTAELVLELFARSDIHERTDKTLGRAVGRPQNQGAFEHINISSIS